MPEQEKILLELEEKWEDHDVFVIDGPVAVGKSFIALTLLIWQQGGSYIVPDNVLLDQIMEDFPEMPKLKGREHYICGESGLPCMKQQKIAGTACRGCDMIKDWAKSRNSPYGLYTYFGYFSNRRYRPLLIVDEAHRSLAFLREMYTQRIWRHKYNYPWNLNTPEDVVRWVDTRKGRDKKLNRLKKVVTGEDDRWISYKTREYWHREEKDLIKNVPIYNLPQGLWPPDRVKKIVLMSATLSKMDQACLNLGGRRIAEIKSTSPIPSHHRPIRFLNTVKMSWENREQAIPKLVEQIHMLAMRHEGESGVIHAPYGLAESLRKYLGSDPRFIWHGKDTRQEGLSRFLSEPGRIFVASGFYEGVSFNYDKARWQLVTKAMFPSKADPFISQMSEKNQIWYVWEAIRIFLQTYGRVCRRPDDRGVTYASDTALWNLYQKYPGLFPSWFKQAVVPPPKGYDYDSDTHHGGDIVLPSYPVPEYDGYLDAAGSGVVH